VFILVFIRGVRFSKPRRRDREDERFFIFGSAEVYAAAQ